MVLVGRGLPLGDKDEEAHRTNLGSKGDRRGKKGNFRFFTCGFQNPSASITFRVILDVFEADRCHEIKLTVPLKAYLFFSLSHSISASGPTTLKGGTYGKTFLLSLGKET